MDRLRPSDLRGALDLVAEVDSSDSLEGFAHALLESLPGLISCDVLSYNELNPRHGGAVFLAEPREILELTPEPLVAEYVGEHPRLRYFEETADSGPTTLSDFWSRRQFHDTALYQEVYRLVEGEFQLVTNLVASPTLVIGIALFRELRDFSERDRAMLELLTPYLANAYRNVETRTQLRAAYRGMRANQEHVLMIDRDGRIRGPVDGNVGLLEEFFGRIGGRGNRLPDELVRWVREQSRRLEQGDAPDVSEPLVVRGPDAELSVRLVRRSVPDGRDALMLQRRSGAPSPEALVSLGLSRRESEVLALAAQGRTNAQIASELYISPRTAKKHLESIYGKLGVPGRTAATAAAYRASSA